jgi:hypothetical protein
MTPPSSIVNPSREEVWWANFDAVDSFYKEHQHLTIPDKRLSDWLTYQRHHAKMLNKDKLDALARINYKSVEVHRECDEREWETNFNQLIPASSTKKDRKLQLWIARQRRLVASGRLSVTRKQRLLEHGIDLRPASCAKRGREEPSKLNESNWMVKFAKLVKYLEEHSHCNVPTRYTEDSSLGNWVRCQRIKYHEVGPDGLPKLTKNRIAELEEIGFQWEVKR